MESRLRLPSPAMAVAFIALCFAVGGGSYLTVANGDAGAAAKKKKAKVKRGPAGPQGPPGAPGATNVVIRSVDLNVSANNNNGSDVFCQAGERALSGGAHFTSGSTNDDRLSPVAPLKGSPGSGSFAGPGETPTGFNAGLHNGDGVERPARVWVVCARP